VSLLLSEGHSEARNYPIAVSWSEARIIRQRHAARRRAEAAQMQMVIASVFDSKAGKQLQAVLKRLDESD
jgi:GTP cyclohydrolase FolE2